MSKKKYQNLIAALRQYALHGGEYGAALDEFLTEYLGPGWWMTQQQPPAADPAGVGDPDLFTILADCSRCGEPLNETELSYLDGLPICESCRMIAEAAGGSAPAGQ